MQHLEGSGTPVLYIGRTVLKGEAECLSSGNRRILHCVIRMERKRLKYRVPGSMQ